MADEEKKEEVVEEAAEAEATEEKGKKKDKKDKKEKSSVDVNAIMNNVKGGISTGSEKVSTIVKEANDKKKMMIFLAIIVLEVVLSAVGGVGALMLVIQAIVALVGFIALKAAFPGEEKAEESAKEE